MRTTPRIAAAIAVLALVGAGCGKNENVTVPTSPTATTSAPASAPVQLSGTVNNHGTKTIAGAKTLELEQDNYYFSPTFLEASRGQSLTVTLKNEGTVEHNFTIDSLHINVTLQPNTEKPVTVKLPASGGAVNFYCVFHRGMGMQGAFFFGAAPGGAVSTSPPATSAPGGGSGY
jgi:plastocyanin